MPTYEKYDGDGNMVERSVTFLGTPHDFQLSTISSMTDSPWRRVADVDDAPALALMPVFTAPSDEDADDVPAEPGSPTALAEEAERHKHDDEPDESGDHTEE